MLIVILLPNRERLLTARISPSLTGNRSVTHIAYKRVHLLDKRTMLENKRREK